VLLVIGLQNLGVGTYLCAYGGRQHGPPIVSLGPFQSLRVHHQAIAALFLRGLALWRTSPACALWALQECFDAIAEAVIAPGLRSAATPALTAAFIVCYGRLGIGGTRILLGGHARDMLRYPLRFLGPGCGIGHGLLLGERARMHHHKPHVLLCHTAVCILHVDAANDTLPMPASGGVALGTARFFE
jgi:hypothetical protein